jgi:EAL domain-containing protein (putative c-di-GMP-specific phosphodiesterase class I)
MHLSAYTFNTITNKSDGKKTIADFVENEQVLKQVKLIAIDYAQGYHISKPVPLNQLGKHGASDYEEAK